MDRLLEILAEARKAVLRQLDLGADGVILHGASPTDLAPVIPAYRAIRPAGRFDLASYSHQTGRA